MRKDTPTETSNSSLRCSGDFNLEGALFEEFRFRHNNNSYFARRNINFVLPLVKPRRVHTEVHTDGVRLPHNLVRLLR